VPTPCSECCSIILCEDSLSFDINGIMDFTL
jgi:hypothetical protein